ncbi:MAG TPA: hypothetical protein EYP74_04095 [Anaerolineales bacterium]|nr:hypothetical protein [Anaerolineales bacterium]
MNNVKTLPKKIWRVSFIIAAMLSLAAILLSPASAQAKKIIKTNLVQVGKTIENDVFLTGENPLIEGTVNGDVFVFGSNLTIKGDVNGSVIAIAEKINLEGNISGNLYALTSGGYTQKTNAQIERSLYLFGLSLLLEKDAKIGRDLNALTLSAGLRGEIGRDTNATVGLFELLRLLNENLRQTITGIPAPEQFVQLQRIPRDLGDAPRRALMRISAFQAKVPLQAWLLSSLTAFASFLIVGLLSLWMFPAWQKTWVHQLDEKPLASAGYGALVLINGYLMPILLVALLGGAVLGLLYISLPSLAWMLFWGILGLSVAIFSLFLVAVAFLSKTIVAYWVGEFILSKLVPKALQYKVLSLLLGLLIYVPLASIRYVGFFVGLVVTMLGLGTLWLTRNQAQIARDAEVESA